MPVVVFRRENMWKKYLILIVIFALGILLRSYNLSSSPPLMHYDEASYGYNAFSILKTGRDEFGSFLPGNIRAFDDFRPPVYTYLLALVFKAAGLSDAAIRFPSLFAGIVILAAIYFLAREIIGGKYAIFAFFTAAVNPVLILFSRAAFDANLALAFSLIAIGLFFRYVRSSGITTLVCVNLFATAAVLSYQATKVFLPLLFLFLIITYRKPFIKNLFESKLSLAINFLTVIFCLLPIIYMSKDVKSIYRFTSLSIFNNEALIKKSIAETEFNRDMRINQFSIFANRRVIFFEEGLKRYLDNYNPSFLFTYHFDPSSIYQIPNLGNFHYIELPFFIIGIVQIGKILKRNKKIILGSWLLLSAIPVAFLAFGPQEIRMLQMFPLIIFVVAVGLQTVWTRFKILISALYLLSVVFLIYNLFILMPEAGSFAWMGNYRQMVIKAESLKGKYRHIYVSNSLQRPYIFFLWYARYDPNAYLHRGIKRSGNGFNPIDSFDKYTFTKLSSLDKLSLKSSLLIGDKSDFLTDARPIKTIGCDSNFQKQCFWFVEER